MEILWPLLAETGAEPIGKIVVGTVKGDVNDISKNLTAMSMLGASFKILDSSSGRSRSTSTTYVGVAHHRNAYMKIIIDTLAERQWGSPQRGARVGNQCQRLLPRCRRRGRDRPRARRRRAERGGIGCGLCPGGCRLRHLEQSGCVRCSDVRT